MMNVWKSCVVPFKSDLSLYSRNVMFPFLCFSALLGRSDESMHTAVMTKTRLELLLARILTRHDYYWQLSFHTNLIRS